MKYNILIVKRLSIQAQSHLPLIVNQSFNLIIKAHNIFDIWEDCLWTTRLHETATLRSAICCAISQYHNVTISQYHKMKPSQLCKIAQKRKLRNSAKAHIANLAKAQNGKQRKRYLFNISIFCTMRSATNMFIV